MKVERLYVEEPDEFALTLTRTEMINLLGAVGSSTPNSIRAALRSMELEDYYKVGLNSHIYMVLKEALK